MKTIIIAALTLTALALSSCSRAGGPQPTVSEAPGSACLQLNEQILNIREIRQLANNWCWAASGEMVLSHYNQAVRQCKQVSDRLGNDRCCDLVINQECDQTGWPDFQRYNLRFQKTSKQALTWDQIKTEIACKRNPIAFSWAWAGGGTGHMMVIKGFRSVDGVNWVLVNDPMKNPNYRIMRYDMYVESAGNHTHWDDFYDFKRAN